MLNLSCRAASGFLRSRGLATSSQVILGIETSCDDTAISLVSSDLKILENRRIANRDAQQRLGGICPSVSAEQHRSTIDDLVSECLQRQRLRAADLRAVAVSDRPGLVICLKVGLSKALALARDARLDVVPVHHMRAHAMTPFLTDSHDRLQFPYVCALISGGHSLICLAKDPDHFEIYGESVAGSPGEAFDKIGRELRLHESREFTGIHPGAAIEILARRATGVSAYPVKSFPYTVGADFDFHSLRNQYLTTLWRHGGEIDLPSFCASVQFSVTAHICAKLHAALEFIMKKHQPKHLVVSGGVASNQYILKSIRKISEVYGLSTIVPAPELCTDNAAMVASAAWKMIEYKSPSVIPYASLPDSLYAHARYPIGTDKRQELPSRPSRRLSLKSLHGDCPVIFYNNDSKEV
uniref:N(6)-L-threonylcarbamoyladenine synthase n=1 Tax=Steinernema glaseri TaxID=37863 RepID=A0A1I7ZHQ7_9BILA